MLKPRSTETIPGGFNSIPLLTAVPYSSQSKSQHTIPLPYLLMVAEVVIGPMAMEGIGGEESGGGHGISGRDMSVLDQ